MARTSYLLRSDKSGSSMRIIKLLAQKIGIFEKLRYSRFYPLYDRIFNPQNEVNRLNEIAFYQRFFGQRRPQEVIFDIGANQGFKTRVFTRLGFKTIALEPDRSNAAHLRREFKNASNVIVVEKAVSDRAGFAQFHSVEDGSAYNTLELDWLNSMKLKVDQTYQVETTTLDDLVKEFGLPIFLKIDVEGHEESVLRGLHYPVALISLESNRKFREGTIKCIDHLCELSTDYRFSFTIELNYDQLNWVEAQDFKKILLASQDSYFEVLAKLQDKKL